MGRRPLFRLGQNQILDMYQQEPPGPPSQPLLVRAADQKSSILIKELDMLRFETLNFTYVQLSGDLEWDGVNMFYARVALS